MTGRFRDQCSRLGTSGVGRNAAVLVSSDDLPRSRHHSKSEPALTPKG